MVSAVAARDLEPDLAAAFLAIQALLGVVVVFRARRGRIAGIARIRPRNGRKRGPGVGRASPDRG
jgi:hypothetical protein|tara:strand:+ start:3833 stop:4027 length:195 start_codon:yes stop_codon:yes gene_type:complete